MASRASSVPPGWYLVGASPAAAAASFHDLQRWIGQLISLIEEASVLDPETVGRTTPNGSADHP
jgi:hypothetical protein